MQPKTLSDVVQVLAQQSQEKEAAALLEAQTKLITISYDKAAAYTTVIVFGGYAGFFAIWQLSKDYLSKEQALWSALAILLSLLAFVSFEVVKMVLVTRSIFKRAAILRDPSVRSNPVRLRVALDALADAQHAGQRGYIVAWICTLVVAVGGALAGAVVLGYAFVTGLAK